MAEPACFTQTGKWVLQTVTQGYHIPLISEPIQETTPHNPSYQEEIHEKQVIQKVPAQTKGLNFF